MYYSYKLLVHSAAVQVKATRTNLENAEQTGSDETAKTSRLEATSGGDVGRRSRSVESGGVANFWNLGQLGHVGSQQNDADLAMQMV